MTAASELAEHTVLEVGARGKMGGAPFVLSGRTCVRSSGGGVWNEWLATFDDGRRAYLAEAMGAFALFHPRPLAPAFDALVVGAPLETGFVVVERGEARRVASWGEVEEAPKAYRYADLSGPNGEVATIDYGRGGADVFVGRRVRLAELGLLPRAEPRRFLPAPGGAAPRGTETWLAVGDTGELDKTRFRVIGIAGRSIRIDSERYTWQEYVLFAPAEGLRWLVVSDGHWNLVETIEPGRIAEIAEERASYEGETHRFVSSGRARLDWAIGELPWEAAVGDTVSVRDYARAPYALSCEASEDEITWTRGTYTPPDVVARAFGKRVLPKPAGRAPNQPRTVTQPQKRR